METDQHDERPEDASKPSTPRRRRWAWLLAAALVVIWFAPAIAVRTPLKSTIVSMVDHGLNAKLSVGSIDTGWLSPLVLRNVTLHDEKGNLVARAASVRSTHTLWALASASTDVGTFVLKGVKARVEADSGGSNLEDIIAPLLEGPSSGDVWKYRVDFADSVVLLVDRQTGTASQLTDVTGSVSSTPLGNSYPEVTVDAKVHPGEATAAGGQIGFRLAWSPPEKGEAIRGRARLQGDRMELAAFAPAVTRFLPGTRCSGLARCDIALEWSDDFDRPEVVARGGLAASNVKLFSSRLLAAESLSLASAEFGVDAQLSNHEWTFRRSRLRTDFADVSVTGTLSAAGGVIASPQQDPFSLSGSVDIAGLANRLPNTVRLQDGLQMTEGRAALKLTAEEGAQGAYWTASLQTGPIRATRQGQLVSWDDPLRLELRLRQHQQTYLIDHVEARSEFLTLSGRGTLDDASIEGDCDLSQLMLRVGQFIDTQDWQLAGRVKLNGDFRRDAGGQFQASAELVAQDFAARMQPDSPVWQETNLRLDARGSGQISRGRVTQLGALSVTLTSGQDALSSRLLRPVVLTDDQMAVPIHVSVRGALESWMPRLRPLGVQPPGRASGAVDFSGQAVVTSSGVAFDETQLTATDLVLKLSDDWTLAEPRVTASATGRFDPDRSRMVLSQFEWLGAAAQISGSDLDVRFDSDLTAAGRCTFRADMTRLSRWRKAAAEHWTGQLGGDAVVETKRGEVFASLDATLRSSNLLASLQPDVDRVAANQEQSAARLASSATLAARLQYHVAKDELSILKARLESDALGMDATGQMRDLRSRVRTDVTGTIAYDFSHLTSLLRSAFGDHVQIVGRGSYPFEIHGPLNGKTENLSATAKATWESATVFGIRCGPGTVDASLRRMVLKAEPITFTVNGGTARVLPRVKFEGQPTLVLARGTELRDVALTEEITAEWLRYVTPLLADSTRVNGQFSAAVSNAAMPLNTPEQSDIAGVVRIHNAEALPGPLVNQLIGIVDQVRLIAGKRARGARDVRLSVPEQDVTFRMLDQRVHHKNFGVEIDGFQIRTSGSVGLDQSLQLIVELTLPAKWLGSGSLARSLAERPLRIPVSGTFGRPRLDASVLRGLAGQAGAGAVDDLLKQQLDRGLNRLFDKIK